jgi:peptide/nickel transport system permease protein
MDGWQKLQRDSLARLGILLLLVFYLLVVAADFFAPANPYTAQANAPLLPPTPIYWRNTSGDWIGPHVYPTIQGPVDLQTGDRQLIVDRQKPSPIRWFVKDWTYQFLELRLPLPTRPSLLQPEIKEVVIFPGFRCDRHLFGTAGSGKLNLLGTDEQARDQFSRLLFGGRISLSIGLVGVVIAFPLGLLIGGISGYLGGWVDALIMRLVEVLMTIPSLYLLIALRFVFSGGAFGTLSNTQLFFVIVLIISLVNWAGLARVIRGQVLSLKEREFIQAARAMGGTPLYIIIRHILPQTTTYAIISATLTIPSFIVAESVLSLIGLGIQPPDPSWGNMLSIATNASILVLQPWLVWSPAIPIILAVLAFNIVGDSLRDAFDPRSLKG